jgi:hypothetical protein
MNPPSYSHLYAVAHPDTDNVITRATRLAFNARHEVRKELLKDHRKAVKSGRKPVSIVSIEIDDSDL